MTWDSLARMLEGKLEAVPLVGSHRKFRVMCGACGGYIATVPLSRQKGRRKEVGDDIVASVAASLGVTMRRVRLLDDCTESRQEFLASHDHAH